MRLLIAAAFALAAGPAFADDDPSAEDLAKIHELLATMQCEVDGENVEKEDDGGFELDDVFCADGQYDIDLDASFAVVEKRKE